MLSHAQRRNSRGSRGWSARSLVAGLLSLASPIAGAQQTDSTATIRGVVTANAAPLPGVQVAITGLNLSTMTDSAGRFALSGVPAGRYEVVARKVGYAPATDTVGLRPGVETALDFRLERLVELDTVRTTADEMHYNVPRLQDFEARRRKNIGGHFIGEVELRKMESVSIPSILRRIPGLSIVQYRGRSVVKSRGVGSLSEEFLDPSDGRSPRGCWASVYLDGVVLFDGKPKSHDLPPDMGVIFAMNLSGIEYYSGAATVPLQFKTLNGCGTLLLWTRGR